MSRLCTPKLTSRHRRERGVCVSFSTDTSFLTKSWIRSFSVNYLRVMKKHQLRVSLRKWPNKSNHKSRWGEGENGHTFYTVWLFFVGRAISQYNRRTDFVENLNTYMEEFCAEFTIRISNSLPEFGIIPAWRSAVAFRYLLQPQSKYIVWIGSLRPLMLGCFNLCGKFQRKGYRFMSWSSCWQIPERKMVGIIATPRVMCGALGTYK